MTKKPIVLSLLLMLFMFVVMFCFNIVCALFKLQMDIVIYPLIWASAAFIVGIIYTKTNKEPLSKIQKVKALFYTLSILLVLFLSIMAFMLDIFGASPFRLIVRLLFLILPTFMIILSAFCAYPALSLGSRIANTDKLQSDNRTNLYDVLIIVFCLIFGVFAVKFNTYALNAIKPHVIKYSLSKGYIRKTPQLKIEQQ